MNKKEDKVKLGLYIKSQTKQQLDNLKSKHGLSASDLIDNLTPFDLDSFQNFLSLFLESNTSSIDSDADSFFSQIEEIMMSFNQIQYCQIIPFPMYFKIKDEDLTLVFLDKSGEVKTNNLKIDDNILAEYVDSCNIYTLVTNIASFFLSKRELIILLQNLEDVLNKNKNYVSLRRHKNVDINPVSLGSSEECRLFLSLGKALKIKDLILKFLLLEERQTITF